MSEERRAPHPMLVELAGDMKVVKDRQETMYEQLFGNGQPGILDKHSKRLSELEKWRYLVVGAATLAATIGGVLVKVLIK